MKKPNKLEWINNAIAGLTVAGKNKPKFSSRDDMIAWAGGEYDRHFPDQTPESSEKNSTLPATSNQCPYCFSENIQPLGNREQRDSSILETVQCLFCEIKWVEIYTLTRRENGHAEIIQKF